MVPRTIPPFFSITTSGGVVANAMVVLNVNTSAPSQPTSPFDTACITRGYRSLSRIQTHNRQHDSTGRRAGFSGQD